YCYMEGGNELRKLYFFPAKNLMISIPLILILAVIIGFQFDTSWMSSTMLIATMTMIYPTMIGVQWKSLMNLKEKKLISYALIINFIAIPIVAFILGFIFL